VARALLCAVVLDLLVGRVGFALLGGRPPIGLLAGFTHHLVGVLALLTSFVGVYGLLGDSRRFGTVGRASVALTSAAFLPLAGLAIVANLPGWLGAHIYSMFVLAIAGVLVASLSGPAPNTARTGIFCLAVGPLAYGLGAVLASYATALPPALGVLAGPVSSVGRAAALLLGIPALMTVRPARVLAVRDRTALIAAAATLAVAGLVAAFPGLLAVTLGVSRPPALVGRVLALLSLFLTLLALGTLRGVSPRRRAIARGLSLLLLTGFVLDVAGNLVVVHAAFVLLVRGVSMGAPADDRWRDYLAAMAKRVDAGEPVVIGLRGEEISRMRIENGPIDLRLARRGDEIVQIDVTAGSPPRSPPAWSARHRGAEQPRTSRLPEAGGRARSDSEFGRELIVHGDGAVGMLDDELLRQLLALPPGAVAVWPAEGARWRAFPANTRSPDRPVSMSEIDAGEPAPLLEDLVGVVRVVREVARRAGIRC